MSFFALAQIFGFFGFITNVVRFQMPQHQSMRLCNVFSLSFFAVSYGLLESPIAMWLCLFAALRSLILLWVPHPVHRWGVFIITFLLSAYISFHHNMEMYEYLAFLGVILGGFADVQTRTIRMRSISLSGHFTWLFFNIIIGSYGAVASNVMVLVSNFVGLYRYHRHDIYPYAKKLTQPLKKVKNKPSTNKE